MNETPEPWASAMVEVGLIDPRRPDAQIPSISALAGRVGKTTTTVSRLIHGRVAKPDTKLVAAVARSLRKDVLEVSEWVGQARTDRTSYVPPAEVDLLTDRERDAVSELILAIAATRQQREDEEHDARSPADTQDQPKGEVPTKRPRTATAVVEDAALPGSTPAESANRLPTAE